MESFESEDDIKDIATRMQALAPKLSPSHEVGAVHVCSRIKNRM